MANIGDGPELRPPRTFVEMDVTVDLLAALDVCVRERDLEEMT
jgi:hypothetical protein